MIIKNNLGLDVSIDKEDMEYVVSKYQGKFDDITTLESFEKEVNKAGWNVIFAGLLGGGLLIAASKYVGKLKEEASQEVLRELHRDERATDVFKEMFYGGK